MKIKPLYDRIVVKRLEEERKTASGIVIPDTAAEKPEPGRSHRRRSWKGHRFWRNPLVDRQSWRQSALWQIRWPSYQN